MVWKIFFAIIMVFLLLGAFFEPINDGIKGWRTEDTTQYEIVATAAGVTTANVTLDAELYQDDVTEVISVSSNETETPVATSYTASGQILLVSALTENMSRTLTLNYYGETENEVIGVLGPFLSFLIIGGLLFGIVYSVFKGKRR